MPGYIRCFSLGDDMCCVHIMQGVFEGKFEDTKGVPKLYVEEETIQYSIVSFTSSCISYVANLLVSLYCPFLIALSIFSNVFSIYKITRVMQSK